MLEDTQYLGRYRYEEPEDLSARLGYSDPPTHVSLFSGIGGFDLGFAQAGFENLVAVERDQDAADTYRANLINDYENYNQENPPVLMERDIQNVATWEILEAAGVGVGQITTITGGPPCQGFSHLNTDRGDDPRNELYLEMVRVVNQAKPVMFVMENVPGLATMHDGDAIRQVCEDFQQAGYHVKWRKLNAVNFGVPQQRERIFVLGKRVDVAGLAESGPQYHMAAKPGRIEHPEWFRAKDDLDEPEQTKLDAFGDEPETLDEVIEQAVQNGTLPDGSEDMQDLLQEAEPA